MGRKVPWDELQDENECRYKILSKQLNEAQLSSSMMMRLRSFWSTTSRMIMLCSKNGNAFFAPLCWLSVGATPERLHCLSPLPQPWPITWNTSHNCNSLADPELILGYPACNLEFGEDYNLMFPDVQQCYQGPLPLFQSVLLLAQHPVARAVQGTTWPVNSH